MIVDLSRHCQLDLCLEVNSIAHIAARMKHVFNYSGLQWCDFLD